MNTDENSQWAMKYGVQGIPRMLFIANGKVVQQQVGILPEAMLRQILEVFLKTVAVAS
ncbi:MAG: thioredoxin domain-containing protein [Anaerolineaceae bacterium]